MPGDLYTYTCTCGVEFDAHTWDPHELPKIWCPECGEEMDCDLKERHYDP